MYSNLTVFVSVREEKDRERETEWDLHRDKNWAQPKWYCWIWNPEPVQTSVSTVTVTGQPSCYHLSNFGITTSTLYDQHLIWCNNEIILFLQWSSHSFGEQVPFNELCLGLVTTGRRRMCRCPYLLYMQIQNKKARGPSYKLKYPQQITNTQIDGGRTPIHQTLIHTKPERTKPLINKHKPPEAVSSRSLCQNKSTKLKQWWLLARTWQQGNRENTL